jgi:hypothetical protein
VHLSQLCGKNAKLEFGSNLRFLQILQHYFLQNYLLQHCFCSTTVLFSDPLASPPFLGNLSGTMRIIQYTPTHLKLVHCPRLIWACAALSWLIGCICLILLPSGLLLCLLLNLPLILISFYPIVICELSKHRTLITVQRYSLLGRRVVEYPMQMVLAIEMAEARYPNGSPFYTLRLIAKVEGLDLVIAPIEDFQNAKATASRLADFLNIPYRLIPMRSRSRQEFA